MRHPFQWPLVFLALAQIKFRSMFNDLIKKRHMMTLSLLYAMNPVLFLVVPKVELSFNVAVTFRTFF